MTFESCRRASGPRRRRKIGTDDWIGRYTPTANGSDGTPANSSVTAINTPINTSSQGSLCCKMPSMISAINRVFGASNLFDTFDAVVAHV